MKYQHFPRHQLELLLAHLFNQDRLWVLTHGESQLSDKQEKDLVQYVSELMSDTPLAYIVGYKRFYDVNFAVNKHVLIPRQETEELIQHVYNQYHAKTQSITIADVGTGSGCIGLTLVRLFPEAQFYLIDKSKDALAIATKNHERQQSPINVKFFHGDLIQPLIDLGLYPEIVIANLPYISADLYHELPISVARYEPRLALDGGQDGMVLYRQLLEQINHFYGQKPWPDLWFEISPEQKDLVIQILAHYNKTNVEFISDLNQRIRFVKVLTTLN